MNEEEIIKKHFAKIGSKGGRAGTGSAKRRKGSEDALQRYWEDVKAGRREPPKGRGRPPKTSKLLADTQPASQDAPVESEKPVPEKPTEKPVVSRKNAELRPRRPVEEVLREGREAAEKARKEKEKSPERMVIVDENNRRVKNDRNLPCPCGSGKKFKKCCGA